MTNEKHTPEPWSVGYTRKQPCDPRIGPFFATAVHFGAAERRGNCIAEVYGHSGLGTSQADAARIAGCVNLCAGIPQSILDAAPVGHAQEWFNTWCSFAGMDDPKGEYARLRETAERAIKMEAALRAVQHLWKCAPESGVQRMKQVREVQRQVRAALVKMQP